MKILMPFFLLLVACSGHGSRLVPTKGKTMACIAAAKYKDHSWLVPFDRSGIQQDLAQKIEAGEPLVVHCVVPLCDNNYQGIVPTTPSLGDGFSTRTNLYWATRHGMKRYFELHRDWRKAGVSFTPSDTILERVCFRRDFQNGAAVILVCDAYRGDQMRICLDDYFGYLAGKISDSLLCDGTYIRTGAAADMLVFNGHNGLMDVQPEPVFASRQRQKDAVVIACSSQWNYVERITNANCYPLVTTTSSLYPGATVLDRIIEKWALNATAETIRLAAAGAYDEMKNCGMADADALFYTGW
jgi:hypothetical protein